MQNNSLQIIKEALEKTATNLADDYTCCARCGKDVWVMFGYDWNQGYDWCEDCLDEVTSLVRSHFPDILSIFDAKNERVDNIVNQTSREVWRMLLPKREVSPLGVMEVEAIIRMAIDAVLKQKEEL